MNGIKELTKEELRRVYEERMVVDFPPEELKPFAKIEELYDGGRYAAYSVADPEGAILSYALFARLSAGNTKSHYLFDYFAVREDLRNEGIGTLFLRRLAACLPDAESVIGEVENPQYAGDAEESELRKRRLRFYRRNGLRECGVTSRIYGVEYRILEVPLGKIHSAGEVREILGRFYRLFFSEEVLKRQVIVR